MKRRTDICQGCDNYIYQGEVDGVVHYCCILALNATFHAVSGQNLFDPNVKVLCVMDVVQKGCPRWLEYVVLTQDEEET
jgi:hypothetical protein